MSNIVELDRHGSMMRRFVEIIARTCHEANRGYCLALARTFISPQVTYDPAFNWETPPWDHLRESERESIRAGVRFHLRNPYASAEAGHKNWLRHKAAEGWKYGPVKDSDKKEHPCMLPYEQLPEEQRIKDAIFKNIVEAFRYYEHPMEDACKAHGQSFVTTSFECCLPYGHEGPCSPNREIDPYEIIRPEATNG